jgi:hypothetical protein
MYRGRDQLVKPDPFAKAFDSSYLTAYLFL